jgi:uncharacterized protein with PhoU and TrkA domain
MFGDSEEDEVLELERPSIMMRMQIQAMAARAARSMVDHDNV